MNTQEANIVLELLRHLDGSRITNAAELIGDVQLLADSAGVALGGALPVDLDRVEAALAVVFSWFDDDDLVWDDEDEDRPVEEVPIGGDVL